MFSHIEEDLNRMCFYDETIFHVCGAVNRHNHHVQGSENPHDVTEHDLDSPMVNVGAF
jgi:hypothetical protein